MRRYMVVFVMTAAAMGSVCWADVVPTTSDLAGEWQIHGLASGDQPDETPGWYWLSMQVDSNGLAVATSTIHDSLV